MASFTPGVNIASPGTELVATVIGPCRVYHDLGANNGDLIRSGNANVVRVAWLPYLMRGASGTPSTSTTVAFARASYPLFQGLANNLSAAATRIIGSVQGAASAEQVTTPDLLIGTSLHNPAQFSFGNVECGSASYNQTCAQVNLSLAGTGASILTPGDYANHHLGMCYTSIDANNVSPFTAVHRLLSVEVTGERTLTIKQWSKTLDLLFAAHKTKMADAVRGDVSLVGAATWSTTIQTGTDVTAKQYLAQFPYFLYQWPYATFPMYLMHACSYVSE